MLPAAWVDQLFTRLAVRYGRDFLARWEGLDLNLVKDDWAHELGFYADKPDAIKHALSILPSDRPPTAAQFRDLCRLAPGPVFKALPPPNTRNEAAAKVLLEVRRAIEGNRPHPKAWALAIIDRVERGEKLPPLSVRMARDALGDRLPSSEQEPLPLAA